MTTRDEILGRLRHALADVPPGEQPGDIAVSRAYRRTATPDIDVLVDRLRDYGAPVRHSTGQDLPEVIAAALRDRGAQRIVAPQDLRDEWLSAVDCEVVHDDGTLTFADLDATDGAVTMCSVVIAETGTIVLDGGAGQGRRAVSLLPDYHLCVVSHDQVVASVPEGLATLDCRRPLTFISGPSATSDIELSRVEGVHGPRTLEVILVQEHRTD